MTYESLMNKWVYIKWIDSAGPTTDWNYRDGLELDEQYAICITVGCIINEDTLSLSVAQSVANKGNKEDEQVCGIMVITKSSIQTISEINK